VSTYGRASCWYCEKLHFVISCRCGLPRPLHTVIVPWQLINPVPWHTPTITYCNNALAAHYTQCLDALYWGWRVCQKIVFCNFLPHAFCSVMPSALHILGILRNAQNARSVHKVDLRSQSEKSNLDSFRVSYNGC